MNQQKVNPSRTAKLAGFLYVSLIPLGVFGIMYIPNNLIVSGNMAATVALIMEHELIFRLSILSAFTVQLVNLVLVFLLYQLLKPVNKRYAALMVMCILVAAPIAMLNELNLLAVLMLLSGSEYLAVFNVDQIHSMISVLLEMHELGIQIASIFWGLWLLPMGYLIIKSGYLPKIIGVLLIVASFGYLVDSINAFIFPNVGIQFSEFLFLGEILIAFWLAIKGVDVNQWQKRSLVME